MRIHNLTKSVCLQICPYSSSIEQNIITFDARHRIHHYPEFVCPQNFRNLADWIYGWPDQFKEEIHSTTQNGTVIGPCLPDGSIIYVRPVAVEKFFDEVYPHLQNQFVLITGEGDLASPDTFRYLHADDSKIIHWFGQNGQFDPSASSKFTHIPIGINCYQMAEAIRSNYAERKPSTIPPIYNEPDEPSFYFETTDVFLQISNQNISDENLVLINFDPGTDRTGFRTKVWDHFCSSSSMRFPFGKCENKPHFVQIENLTKIYRRNRQYPFWLSPRGNGIDCHRTWEALYLDIIPIVWNSSLNVLYENLPVVIINDHRELNASYLRTKLIEIGNKKTSPNRNYAYEKLRNAYWRRLILEKSRYGSDSRFSTITWNKCWIANATDFKQNNIYSSKVAKKITKKI